MKDPIKTSYRLKKIFANHVSDIGFIPRIKNSQNSN